ncbi:hypothetical protein FRB96_000643 [Tulasnella sp. 330]|nr:hypothetical protein FRB96_000643 [Tulasnella sp. 330]KAG8872980.1 hypothetical protein FRB97_007144 [Tulasnella sp. 331]
MSRRIRLPLLEQKPKSNLGLVVCQTIDIELKALRKSSRQASQTFTPLANELQLLERIYYKCKNAQRPTLAWRKVVELRRVGDRAKEANLPADINCLRMSFYDATVIPPPGSKPFKNAWSHAPSVKYLVAVIRRIFLVEQLFTKFLEVCHVTYSALAMYTSNHGFLSLTVPLMAAAARLRYLANEFIYSCTATSSSVLRILEILELGASEKYHLVERPSVPTHQLEATIGVQATLANEGLDLGTKVARTETTTILPPRTPCIESARPVVLEDDAEEERPGLTVQNTPARGVATRRPLVLSIEDSSSLSAISVLSKETLPVKTAKKLKPKKSKRNEIDDIFGF